MLVEHLVMHADVHGKKSCMQHKSKAGRQLQIQPVSMFVTWTVSEHLVMHAYVQAREEELHAHKSKAGHRLQIQRVIMLVT